MVPPCQLIPPVPAGTPASPGRDSRRSRRDPLSRSGEFLMRDAATADRVTGRTHSPAAPEVVQDAGHDGADAVADVRAAERLADGPLIEHGGHERYRDA